MSTVVAVVNKQRQLNNMNDKLKIRPCLFCQTDEHNTSRCPVKMSIEHRCKILTEQKRCYYCFRHQHANPRQCKGPRHGCQICKSQNHYTSMHGIDSSTAPSSSSITTSPATVQDVIGAVGTNQRSTIMLTASAFILNGARKIPVRLFIDHGAGISFISPSARRRLLNVHPLSRADLCLDALETSHKLRADKYRIVIQSVHEPTIKIPIFAYEYSFKVNPRNKCSSEAKQAIRDFGKSHPLADKSIVEDEESEPPALLIGLDQVYRILTHDATKTIAEELIALNSHLGWIVGGPVPFSSQPNQATVAMVHSTCCVATLSQSSTALEASAPPTVSSLSEPARLTEKLWRLDVIGVSDQAICPTLTSDEESAVSQFVDSIEYDGNHYTVAFPKKDSIRKLPNNQSVALARLNRKIAQLQKDLPKYNKYHEEIMKFVQEGHASEIRNFAVGGINTPDGSYYMPHHEVITQSSNGEKWRIVFDCSAKERNTTKKATSLNDHLLAGPNLNPDLVTLLMKFRLHPVAVSADITKAYMRISITDADKPLFRFLWRAPGESQCRAFQMEKITWGATSSGFLLAATIREHFKRFDPSNSEEISNHFYADDFLQSFPSSQEAIELIDRLRASLSSAGMELAKWKTNSNRVTQHLDQTGVDANTLDMNQSNLFKVLGIVWAPKADTFGIHVTVFNEKLRSGKPFTKRFIIGVVASVYDPLGFLIPYTLRGKRIVQKLWSSSLEWDQIASDDLCAEVFEWAEELNDLANFKLPRHYSPSTKQVASYHLHVFGDASQTAYACAAYIEYRYVDHKSTFALIMAKSRLAPKEPPSLPRLELLAALIAVRLKVFITQRISIKFESVRFYTDSTITYHWVTTAAPGNWKTFVSNRVTEIQKHSSAEEWFHVEGEANIVDLATRGIPARTLVESHGWWHGPAWLHQPLKDQPISRPRIDNAVLSPATNEIRHVIAPVVIEPIPQLVNFELFTSAHQIVRVVANVLRFVKLTRRLPVDSVALHREAEKILIQMVQQQYFQQEFAAIRDNDRLPRTSKLSAFQLFIDVDGILRARTRLTEGPHFTYDEKNPIVLPGEPRFTKLLILDAHRANAHFGVANVLSQLRRRFWIIRGRQVIKTLLSKCVVCRKRHGPHADQIEAPLPPFRSALCAPFQVAGVDFCGHFFVRTGKETQKVYIALFTCSATRAVHLEVVPCMSTPETHLALRRFLAIYPACKRIVSDNGRSFVKAASDVKRLFNSIKHKETKELLLKHTIEWDFICPRAPWHGGFYERLVGTVKGALIKTLGRSLVTFEEFRTITAELTAVVNDRPVTFVAASADAPAALTPAQLLRGGPSTVALATLLPLDPLGPSGLATGEEFRKEHRRRTAYFKALSTRWHREYMLQLRSAHASRGRASGPIPIGEVCLLKEDNVSRLKWPLVRVVNHHPGRDGSIRTYSVRFPNGNVSRRAAQLLYSLEVSMDSPISSSAASQA